MRALPDRSRRHGARQAAGRSSVGHGSQRGLTGRRHAKAGRPAGTSLQRVHVEEVTAVSDDVVAAFARLIPQLSSSSPPPGPAELAALVDAPGTTVFVAARQR